MKPISADICRDLSRSSKLEWLETNGTGAFAMGTVSGVNTRRYHALLVATLRPPVERKVLLSRIEDEAIVEMPSGSPGKADWSPGETKTYKLGACQYPGTVSPRGFELLEEFHTDPCATWRFNLDGVTLEKQVYLIEGKQGVVIRYRSDHNLTMRVRPFLAYRDYHSLGHARPDVFGGLPHVDFYHDGSVESAPDWYHSIEYLVELDRGMDFREDLYTPFVIVLHVKAGEWTPICASIDGSGYTAPVHRPDPFTVNRADGAPTIIAGYPWFTDWGRDTMISLPGLLITPGRFATARAILEGFLGHMDKGIVPNRFPDAGETPEYNTADATLWMFQAVRAWIEANPNTGQSRAFLRDVFYPAAKEIITWHQSGTWYDIGVDPSDHLLRAGTAGTQLTWMDAKVGEWVVTPRHGKPVEINALWHGALRLMARWAVELADDAAEDYRHEADRVRESFRAKFWNASRNCLYDVITDHGPIAKLRPNQVFAVSLPFDLLDADQRKAVVEIVQRELLTPVGLRTLERSDPEYKPRYQGPMWERDGAYHQGTVWPWLIGPFVDAYLAAYGRSAETVAYCRGLIDALESEAAREGCTTSIAEIYDADEPRYPRGCPAQAWSVAEVARVKAILERRDLTAATA